MAMPVIGAILQVFASYVIETTGKRKLIFLVSGFIHRPLWILIALVPFFILPVHNDARVWSITIIIAISSAANSIVGISFNSWMGSLIPIEVKGRFFGKRAMIFTIASLISALLSGIFLDYVPGFMGYAVVFIVAAVLGTIDIMLFIWVKDPVIVLPERRIPFHKLFIEPFKDKNYMKYILFVSLWYFGVNIVSPFFNRYMLEELHMTFFIMSIFTQVIANFSTILFVRFWGRLIDKYGSKPIMLICCSMIFAMPFSWLFVTPQNYWMIMIINFFSGIFWPGFDLTAMNQSIWLAPEKNRSIYIANYTLIVSIIGTALAFLGGGVFMEFTKAAISDIHIPFLLGQKLNSYHLLFVFSGIIRFLVLILLFKTYKEDNSQSAGKVLRDIKNGIKEKLLSRLL